MNGEECVEIACEEVERLAALNEPHFIQDSASMPLESLKDGSPKRMILTMDITDSIECLASYYEFA